MDICGMKLLLEKHRAYMCETCPAYRRACTSQKLLAEALSNWPEVGSAFCGYMKCERKTVLQSCVISYLRGKELSDLTETVGRRTDLPALSREHLPVRLPESGEERGKRIALQELVKGAGGALFMLWEGYQEASSERAKLEAMYSYLLGCQARKKPADDPMRMCEHIVPDLERE